MVNDSKDTVRNGCPIDAGPCLLLLTTLYLNYKIPKLKHLIDVVK